MDIQTILSNIAAGENSAAKEGIENMLSAKAFDALQGRKQEMASAIFGGQDESTDETTEDETVNEE